MDVKLLMNVPLAALPGSQAIFVWPVGEPRCVSSAPRATVAL